MTSMQTFSPQSTSANRIRFLRRGRVPQNRSKASLWVCAALLFCACSQEKPDYSEGCGDSPGVIGLDLDSTADSSLAIQISRHGKDSTAITVTRDQANIPMSAFSKYLDSTVDLTVQGSRTVVGRNVVVRRTSLTVIWLFDNPQNIYASKHFQNGHDADSTETSAWFALRDSAGNLHGIMERQDYWCE